LILGHGIFRPDHFVSAKIPFLDPNHFFMSFPSKLVFWIPIITAVVAIALWLSGGKKQEYSAAIQIEASPDVVFAYLTEPEKHKSWITGLAHVERLESNTDENGDPKRITTQRVVSLDGKESKFEDQVIRFEPDASLTVRSSRSSQVITSIYLLEPRDSQTYFTYRVIKLNRGIKRILAPLSSDKTQEQVDDDIRKLKRTVESGN
jgi:hypothetical protein